MKAIRSTVVLALMLGACLGASNASAHGASPAVKVRALPRIINFRQPLSQSVTRIEGRLLDRRPGVRVVLEARRWPFQRGFRPIGKARTRRGGVFEFARRPSLAVRYRVLVPGLGIQSRSYPVYVLPGYTTASCSISGYGRSGGCKDFDAPAGAYTLRIAYKFLYPRGITEAESAKPAFFYYGQNDGSRRPPRILALQGTTYPQLPSGADSTQLVISHPMTLPGTDWSMHWLVCTQTSEETDGFGPPGAPGSSGCGGSTTTLHRALFGRPLG